MNSLDEYVAYFKRQEQNFIHTAVVLIDDRDAQKLLSSWSTMSCVWVKPKSDPPEDDNALWDWVWKGITLPWNSLEERTAINSARLRKIWEPLRANRLVYPDGSIPDHAAGVLKAAITKAISGNRKK